MAAKTRTLLSFGFAPALWAPGERTVRRAALLIFAFFFLLSLTRIGDFTLDEKIFHYPNVLNFYEHGWEAMFNPQYSAANTPLPYLLVAGLAHVFGPSLLLARVVTVCLSFLTLLIAMRLLKKSGAAPVSAFVLLFYPYFFVNSFVFYAVNFGLFFALLALLILGDRYGRPDPLRYFGAGIALSLAVLCQQFYLVMPVALVATRMIGGIARRKSPAFAGGGRRTGGGRMAGEGQTTGEGWMAAELRMAGCHALLLAPLVLPALLFLQWKGLTHPNFRIFSLAFSASTVTALFFVTGFGFLPYLLQEAGKQKVWQWLLALAAAVLLVIYARPVFGDTQGPGLFPGITYHLLVLPGPHYAWVTYAGMTLLTACGILVLFTLAGSLSRQVFAGSSVAGSSLPAAWDIALFSVCLLLALAYSWNTQIAERHLLAMMVFLFLLILPRMRAPAIGWYILGMALLGIGYFVYWTFFKYGGS